MRMTKFKTAKKIVVMSVILLAQAALLWGFYYNEDSIFNFRMVYLKQIYLPSYAYSFNNVKSGALNNLANVSAIFGKNKFGEIFSVSNQQNELMAKSIPVLLYHGVIENPDGESILLEDFKNQMFALKRVGWQTVSIDDFYQFIKGEKELLDKSFLLTFDDGRKDSYYPVDPILKTLDYKATIFIITGHSLTDRNGNYYLSKNELKRMIKSGRWDIQPHTRDGHNFYKIDGSGGKGHFFSNKLWLENEQRIETEEEFKKRIKEDFIGAKNDIKENLGIDSLSFAFPFGDFGQNTINFPESERIILDAVKSIYPLSFYQVWPGRGFSFNYPQGDEFLIKRIDVKPDWSSESLITLLDAGREKPLPYFENLEKYSGWIKTWGSLTLDDNSMILSATDSNNGGAVFLDGSRLWKNYIFKAKIDWVRGKNVSLMARYKEDSNYVSCSFNDKKVKIEQNLNGKKRVMAEKELPFEISKENLELGVAVNNDKLDCLINGDLAIHSYYLSPVLSNGGIGFKIWDKKLNNSKIVVKEVKVEEIKNGENLVFTAISEKYVETEKTVKKELDKKEENSKKEAINIVLAPKIDFKIPKIEEIKNLTATPTLILLPYNVKNFDNTLSWKSLWGGYAIKDNLLHIVSTASTTSGFTILENSGEWTDYLFSAKADLVKGTSLSLVARYKDGKNYVFCSFSNYGKSVSIYQVLNGETKTLGRSGVLPVSFFTPWLNLNFGVKVNGDNIECLINGSWVLRNKIETMPKFGGIGFKIWGDKSYNNEVIIKEINAEKNY